MLNQESDIEDFSAASTLVTFDPPRPLLRGPLPAGLSDDPLIGPFVLAFKDAPSWRSALRASESNIRYQCEAGARIGCSISASSKCRPPWWRTLFGGASIDFSERERCEEREMSACISASQQYCLNFTKDKCLVPFRDARISLIDQKEVSKCILQAFPKSVAKSNCSQSNDSQQPLSKCSFEVTNYRGGDLLVTDASAKDSSVESSSE